jgi:hypothetical protein
MSQEVGDLKKQLYGSRASDHMSWIINDMINMGYDLFLTNWIARSKQSRLILYFNAFIASDHISIGR